jgi:hypothetical protein
MDYVGTAPDSPGVNGMARTLDSRMGVWYEKESPPDRKGRMVG